MSTTSETNNKSNEFKMVEESNHSHRKTVFDSADFCKFLQGKHPAPTDRFNCDGGSGTFSFSKDFFIPSSGNSIFKSKDAFSTLYNNPEWDMDYQSLSKGSSNNNDNKRKQPDEAKSMMGTFSFGFDSDRENERLAKRSRLDNVLSSTDWAPMKTLGSFVDAPSYYQESMFGGVVPNTDISTALPADLPPPKTDWDQLFFSQLQLIPPVEETISLPTTPVPAEEEEEDKEEAVIETEVIEPEVIVEPVDASFNEKSDASLKVSEDGEETTTVAVTVPTVKAGTKRTRSASAKAKATEAANAATSQPPKKKRKRKPRKKVIPEVKVYVEPVDADVLLGRGGRSNHHPGNKRYREEVKNLQAWYLSITNKEEKTDLSQCLVDFVHSYKGRFLEKDSEGWYIVPNIVARRKASQALRENGDPQARAEKRARYLKKKTQLDTSSSATSTATSTKAS